MAKGTKLKKSFNKVLPELFKRRIELTPVVFGIQPSFDQKTFDRFVDNIKEAHILAFRQTARDFIKDMLVPEIRKRYLEKAENEKYWPQINVKGDKDAKQTIGHEDKTTAYEELLNRIITQEEFQKGDTYIIGVGPMDQIMDMKSWNADFHPASRSAGYQTYSTWFYNVEFGTGEYASPAMMRADGPTKDPSGDGSWWLRIANPLDLKESSMERAAKRAGKKGNFSNRQIQEVQDYLKNLKEQGLEDPDVRYAYDSALSALKELQKFDISKGETGLGAAATSTQDEERGFGVLDPEKDTEAKKDPRYKGANILFGARVFGQRGFNLFFDKMGLPNEIWAKFLEEELVPYFNRNFPKIRDRFLRGKG